MSKKKYRDATPEDLNERMDPEARKRLREERLKDPEHEANRRALREALGGVHRPLTAADYNIRINKLQD